MSQTHAVASSQYFNFLGDTNLACASYPGYMILGKTAVDSNSQTYFDPSHSHQLKIGTFFNLTKSLRLAKFNYEERPDSSFTFDLIPPKKKEPYYKTAATFSRQSEMDDPLFSIRNRWEYNRDPKYITMVSEEKIDPIVTKENFKFTRKGFSILPDSLEDLLRHIEKHMLAIYPDFDYSEKEKIRQFVDFGSQAFSDLLPDFLANYHSKKPKDKREFLEKIMLEMMRHNSKFFDGDAYKLKQLKDAYLEIEQLIFSLFNLRVDIKCDQ